MAIRTVVVGGGIRGRDWLREVNASDAFELVALVDANQNVLRSTSASLGVSEKQCFGELETALDKTESDAVIVATSADEHVRPCETALTRKLAVLVEKPFTLRLQEAVDLVSLADANGTPILVAQNYRYMRAFRTAKRLISEGVLGKVGMVVCQYYRPPHDMAASLVRLPNSILWGVGVHHLDALRYVLRKEVTNVSADSFTLPWGNLPPGGSMRVMVSFADQTRALYSATYESSGHEFFERGQEFYARFVGERATLHVFQRWLILCERGKLPRPIRRGKREMTEEQILLGQLERAILYEEPAEVSGRDNLKTMAILEACVRSAREEKWINPQQLLNRSNEAYAYVSNRS
jgi:predicted dehydrogenase